jgi:uncharacterized protein YjdB
MNNGSQNDITSSPGVSWTSSNNQTVTVSGAGALVGVNAGATNVSVAYQGATGTVNCTVSP